MAKFPASGFGSSVKHASRSFAPFLVLAPVSPNHTYEFLQRPLIIECNVNYHELSQRPENWPTLPIEGTMPLSSPLRAIHAAEQTRVGFVQHTP